MDSPDTLNRQSSSQPSNNTTEVLGKYPAGLEAVTCGTDWLGLSSPDLTEHLLKMINVLFGGSDLSLFAALPDRTQQGYINALYLARAMAHHAKALELLELENREYLAGIPTRPRIQPDNAGGSIPNLR